MTKESSDKSAKIISTHYLMVTKVQKVTYFPKILVSNQIGENIIFPFPLFKYRYSCYGEDMLLFFRILYFFKENVNIITDQTNGIHCMVPRYKNHALMKSDWVDFFYLET